MGIYLYKDKNGLNNIEVKMVDSNGWLNREHYNLDMIVVIGFRVNSKEVTKFRIWKTKMLKEEVAYKNEEKIQVNNY